MKTVHQYELALDTIVSAPMGAVPLGVGFFLKEGGGWPLCIWMLVDTEEELALDHYVVTRNGQELPWTSDDAGIGTSTDYDYIGTAQDPGGLVLHVWREQ